MPFLAAIQAQDDGPAVSRCDGAVAVPGEQGLDGADIKKGTPAVPGRLASKTGRQQAQVRGNQDTREIFANMKIV